ncbi:MAG: hypothetical protein GX916_02385 [Clostridiales bacterium]|nr:hypothetical protein [Clostridiales bacterium]
MDDFTIDRVGYLFTPHALAALFGLLGLQALPDLPRQLDEETREAALDWLEDAGYVTAYGDSYAVGETVAFIVHALAGQPALRLQAKDMLLRVYRQGGVFFVVDQSVRGRYRVMPLARAEETADELVLRLATMLPLEATIDAVGEQACEQLWLQTESQARTLLEQALLRRKQEE